MNPKDHAPSLPSGPDDSGREISPELEARLVAWIAGEASPFEVTELERLVREQPALAARKRELEATHALVAEAAQPDRKPLLLGAERREKLLATLRGSATGAETKNADVALPAAPSVVMPFVAPKKKSRHPRTWMVAGAGTAAAALFGFVLVSDFSRKGRSTAAQADRAVAAAQAERKYKIDEEGSRRSREQLEREALAAEIGNRRERNVEDLKRKRMGREGAKSAPPNAEPSIRPIQINLPASSAPATAAEPEAKAALDADGNSIGVLTPFEVTAEADQGYRATSTLAGTRLNLPMQDQAGKIVTPDFLKDVGATNAEGRQLYAAKAEGAPLANAKFDNVQWGFGAPGGNEGGKGREAAANTAAEDTVRLDAFTVSSNREAAAVAMNEGRDSNAVSIDAFGDTKTTEVDKNAPIVTGGLEEKRHAQASQGYDDDNGSSEQPKQTLRGLAAAAPAPAAPKPAVAPRQSSGPVAAAAAPARRSGQEKLAKESAQADRPIPRVAPPVPTLEELSAATEPFSTFSLHVSNVSFRLAQKSLASGQLPEPSSIRAEEFYNAFNYRDTSPAPSEKVGCRIEQSAHPSLQQRNLVRIAVKVPSTGRGAGTPLRLTVLLDNSGSMEREDRAATVRAALGSLVSLLGPNDRLTLIGFARQPRLILDGVAGNQAAAEIAKLGTLPSDGGTNLEEALKLGRELARRHFDTAAQNRLVVLTDGAANLGNADPDALASAVEQLRGEKIAFDACGVGLDGLDDTMLEALTRRGDGRYYVLDSPAAADAGFAKQLAGAFRPAAANVKLQVRFNPTRVGHYRLLGFEKHRLRTEDFRNDKIDAAELAADEAAVAVYQVEALPQGEGELGDVFVRFRDTATGEMVERSWTMLHDARAAAFDRGPQNVQLAGAAALFAELLRDRPADLGERLAELAPVVNSLRAKFPYEPRVAEFSAMLEQARRLAGR